MFLVLCFTIPTFYMCEGRWYVGVYRCTYSMGVLDLMKKLIAVGILIEVVIKEGLAAPRSNSVLWLTHFANR